MIAALLLLAAGGAAPDVVRSPDRALAVWNWDAGRDLPKPQWIQTVRWLDETRPREQIFDDETTRLGWVHAIVKLETHTGPIYVIHGVDREATDRFAVVLTALRLVPGKPALEPAHGFFAGIPGVRYDDDSTLRWRYSLPEKIEAALDEKAASIQVTISGATKKDKKRSFKLAVHDGALGATGLDEPTKKLLEPETP